MNDTTNYGPEYAFEKAQTQKELAWEPIFADILEIYKQEFANKSAEERNKIQIKKITDIVVILKKYAALKNEITDAAKTVLELVKETSFENAAYSSAEQKGQFVDHLVNLCLAQNVVSAAHAKLS